MTTHHMTVRRMNRRASLKVAAIGGVAVADSAFLADVRPWLDDRGQADATWTGAPGGNP